MEEFAKRGWGVDQDPADRSPARCEARVDEAATAAMRRIQAGDAGGLEELIARHESTLRRHLQRYVVPADAEGLLQELWLRVWQRAGQWDGRGRSEEGHSGSAGSTAPRSSFSASPALPLEEKRPRLVVANIPGLYVDALLLIVEMKLRACGADKNRLDFSCVTLVQHHIEAVGQELASCPEQHDAGQKASFCPTNLLSLLDGLYALGITWATKSGASFSPFVGEGLHLPPAPKSDSSPSWYAYRSLLDAAIAAQADADATLRAPMRAVRCGARGSVAALRATIGPWTVADPYDAHGPIAHGFRDGMTPEELWILVAQTRARLLQVYETQVDMAIARRFDAPAGASLLRRAMASDNPAAVFAQAADAGESDPLSDPDVRLWVGLPPT